MKTITIKASDEFAQNLFDMANKLHMSKSEVIRQAFERFRQQQSEDALKQKMQAASQKVRHESEIDDWNGTLTDGLEAQ